MRTQNNARQSVRNKRVTGVLILVLILVIAAAGAHMPRNRTAYAGELPPAAAETTVDEEWMPPHDNERKINSLVKIYFENNDFFTSWQGDDFAAGKVELSVTFGWVRVACGNGTFIGKRKLMPAAYGAAVSVNTFYMEDVHPTVWIEMELPISFFEGGYDKKSNGISEYFHFLPTEYGPDTYFDYFKLDFSHSETGEAFSYCTITDARWEDDLPGISTYHGISLTGEYKSFMPYELPTPPEVAHHTFVGWYIDSALTIPFEPLMILEDVELFPKYVANKYTVIFEANGGTKLEPLIQDALTIVTLPMIERYGYKFEGWYTDAEYTSLYNFDSQLVGNITLYVKWSLKVYTVTLYDFHGNILMRLTVPHGANLKLAIAEAQKKINFAVSDTVDLDAKIEDDIDVDVVIKLGPLARAGNAIDMHFQNNWKWWVVGASIALVLVALILILGKKHGGKK